MNIDPYRDSIRSLATNRADSEAWEILYRTLWPLVVGIMFRLVGGNRETAEDGAQEVMLRLLQYADFPMAAANPEALLAYVRSACRSVAADWYRKHGSKDALASPDPIESADLPAPGHSPEDIEITRDLIEKASSLLTPPELELARSLTEGANPAESATGLNLSLDAYYQRVTRLRKRLREILASF